MARGAYLRVVLQRPDGSTVLDLSQPLGPRRAPAWFVGLLPLSPEPGTASVQREGATVSTVRVESSQDRAVLAQALEEAGYPTT